MRRVLALLVLALALVMTGPVAAAGAQKSGGDGVEELWRQYPLNPSSTDTAPGAATTPGTTTAPAPVTGSADSASAEPAPAPRAQTTASGDPDTRTILLGTAVVALAAAGAAVLLIRRRRDRVPTFATVAAAPPESTIPTYVQGVTDRNGIGDFEGLVSGRTVAPPPVSEPLYLVRDPRREQPVWVRRSEVRTLRTVEAAAAGPDIRER